MVKSPHQLCNSALSLFFQVPGQQLIAPHLTSEAVAAQTSPQARRRRSTRLLKTGSFCSISSEGDGDIFGDDEAEIEAASRGCSDLLQQPRGSTSTGSSGKFDPLSDYSEFHNDDACSDISDLFMRPVTTSPPEEVDLQQPQRLPIAQAESLNLAEVAGISYLPGAGIEPSPPSVSDQHQSAVSHSVIPNAQQLVPGSIPGNVVAASNLQSETCSIDDITFEEVPTVMGQAAAASATSAASESEAKIKDIDQDVSSCSLSIGSEDNNHPQNQLITVPVTIEHPPPEMRQPQRAEAACQQVTPASIAHHLQRPSTATVQDQQTLAPSSDSLPHELQALLPAHSAPEKEMEAAALEAAVATAGSLTVEPGMRMVLVRDIGIQVCGDSPNLNLSRKFKPPSASTSSTLGAATGVPGGSGTCTSGHGVPGTGSGAAADGTGHSHHHHHHHHRHKQTNPNKQDSLAEKFPAEILF